MFSRRAVGCLVAATSLVLTLIGPSSAQSQGSESLIRDPKQLVQSLRSGGYVIVVRHGATFSDRADTDPFNFNDIAKQRNLNEKGKGLKRLAKQSVRSASRLVKSTRAISIEPLRRRSSPDLRTPRRQPT
jgi:hypothetical protein